MYHQHNPFPPAPADPVVEARAARYLERMGPAIKGGRSDPKMYEVACRLVRGFDLAPSRALELLRVYNESCDPPWPDRDLIKKINSALKSARGEPGVMLSGKYEPKPDPDAGYTALLNDIFDWQPRDEVLRRLRDLDRALPWQPSMRRVNPLERQAALFLAVYNRDRVDAGPKRVEWLRKQAAREQYATPQGAAAEEVPSPIKDFLKLPGVDDPESIYSQREHVGLGAQVDSEMGRALSAYALAAQEPVVYEEDGHQRQRARTEGEVAAALDCQRNTVAARRKRLRAWRHVLGDGEELPQRQGLLLARAAWMSLDRTEWGVDEEVANLIRPMTDEEYEDRLAGYPVSHLRRRRSTDGDDLGFMDVPAANGGSGRAA